MDLKSLLSKTGKIVVELWILLAPQCWTEGVIIISSPETHWCLLCCEVTLEKSAHIYVGNKAHWMVGHSIRGKKNG
jgi:hypothetical protein